MSVNSPMVPVVAGRRESHRIRGVSAIAAPSASRATAQRVALETQSRRRGPGAHREPGSTAWRTSMRELVYFLTLGYVQPWRKAQVRPAH
ncbi:MAG: hypothetical protein Q4P32_02470 [Micrococcales bacterium]|nr:hypothetical protein [Micrococcales bacterium]